MKVMKYLSAIAIITLLAACAGTGGKPVTAKGLFQRHVDVAYGGKGMGIHQSVTQKGTMFIDDFGIEAPIVTKVKSPGFMVFETEVMGMQMSQGCNEKECWNQQPGAGTSTMDGEMKDLFKMQADVQAWEHIDQYYDKLEIVPAENPDEATEYTVKATNSYGREHMYYFSKETGLLVGTTMTMDTPMGEMTQDTLMKDYEDFGGVLWPKTMEQNSSMASVRIVIDSVSYDPLSESDFVRP